MRELLEKILSSNHQRAILVAVVLGATAFLTYSNGLHGEFMLDDSGLLLQETRMHDFKFIPQLFLKDPTLTVIGKQPVYYRPLQNVILLFLYKLFGHDVFYYHLINLMVFYLSCLFICILIFLLTESWVIACLASLLFCVHPINTIIINYITAVIFPVQILFMIFGLLTFFLALDKRSNLFYLLSIFWFFLSLLCHEIAMAFPLYLICVLFFVRKMTLKEACLKCAPFFLLLMLYFIFRMQYFSLKVAIFDKIPQFHVSFLSYLASFIKLIGWYFSKLIFPNDIVMILAVAPVDNNLLGWFLIFIVGILACYYVIRKRNIYSLALAWLIIGFVPVGFACFFQPVAGFMIEPHWLFFASIGFFLFFAQLLSDLRRYINFKVWIVFVFCILLANMTMSRWYNVVWRTEKSYTQYWLRLVPNFKSVQFYLASAYMKNKEFDKAREYFLSARMNRYADWEVYTNLGLMDYMEERFDRAIGYYQLALKFNPQAAITYNDLGLALLKENEPKKAEEAFLQTTKLNGYFLESRLNLAALYSKQGKFFEAIQLCEENMKIADDNEDNVRQLFDLYFKTQQIEKCFALGKRVLEKSNDSKQLTNIGSFFARRNYNDMAAALYLKALQENPRYKEVYLEAGKFFGNLEKFSQAIILWQEGLRVDPHDRRFVTCIREAQELVRGKFSDQQSLPLPAIP